MICAHARNHAPSDSKEQRSYLAVILVTADAQLGTRNMEDFCDNPSSTPAPPPNSNSLNKKPSMRTLKNGDRMLKCHSPPKRLPAGMGRGSTQFYFKGQATQSIQIT